MSRYSVIAAKIAADPEWSPFETFDSPTKADWTKAARMISKMVHDVESDIGGDAGDAIVGLHNLSRDLARMSDMLDEIGADEAVMEMPRDIATFLNKNLSEVERLQLEYYKTFGRVRDMALEDLRRLKAVVLNGEQQGKRDRSQRLKVFMGRLTSELRNPPRGEPHDWKIQRDGGVYEVLFDGGMGMQDVLRVFDRDGDVVVKNMRSHNEEEEVNLPMAKVLVLLNDGAEAISADT